MVVTWRIWMKMKKVPIPHILLNLGSDSIRVATLDSYDESLDRRVWTLYNQRLEWNKVVAQKRREIPMDAEALMTDVLGRQRAADDDTTIDLAQNVVQPLPNIGEFAFVWEFD
jgi:hypothetical protein